MDSVGDKESLFKEAFDEYYERLVKFVWYYCRDWEEAKNIAQDTFVALWQSMDKVDRDKSLFPYILIIAKNKTFNYLKKNAVKRKYDSYLKGTEINIAIQAISQRSLSYTYSKELMSVISNSLDSMSESVRMTFLLSRRSNFKNKEIAEMLNISVKTVEYRIMSALRILKSNLQDYL